MKKIARILTYVMVLALILSLAAPAMAAPIGTGTSTITINNAIPGQDYTIYRIAELSSYSGTNYTYKLVDELWRPFFNGKGISVDGSGNIAYNGEIVNAVQFAKDGLALIESDSAVAAITPSQTINATTNTVVFSNLPLGYYLVDSSLGALCMLTNTDPDGVVNEKNDIPVIDKRVEEDSTPGAYGKSNDDVIGATVKFRLDILKVAGATNYVAADNLSDGLTFDAITSVNFGGTPGVAGTDYVLIQSGDPEWANLADYVGTENATALNTAGYDFVVVLKDSAVQAMVDGAEIIIDYTAIINDGAVIGTTGNPNEATLVYGNDPKSMLEPVKTITYVWEFQVFKYTLVDSVKTPLAGATFQLYEVNPETTPGAEPMWLQPMGKDGVYDVYRHFHNPTDADKTTYGLVQSLTTTADGKFIIENLDSGIYYMKETAAPAGYHMLRTQVEINIGVTGAYSGATLGYTVANTVDGHIEVLNSTGLILPETGGIGTIIFITTGSILVLAMGVLLVVKKRMGSVIFTR